MASVAKIFEQLDTKVKAQGAALVSEINGVFIFVVTGGSGETTYVIDLKNGSGSVAKTTPTAEQTDSGVTITLSEEDFVNVFTGKANPQALWASGKLSLEGNMALAMKLQTLTAGAKL